jgi:hypothetical protein
LGSDPERRSHEVHVVETMHIHQRRHELIEDAKS